MKKIAVFLFLAAVATTVISAKEKKDPIVMTVAGKDIPVSEFVFFAKKDNSVDFNNKKSVADYVELFKNYKLKVADAEALTINKAPKFELELEDYKKQLQESFLSDKVGEDSAMRVIYDRSKLIPGFTYIVFRFRGEELTAKDTVAQFEKAQAAYQRIMNGEPLDSVGTELSTDNPGIVYGKVEYVYPLQMMKLIEDKLYTMNVGEIISPLRSISGFHIMRLDRRIPNPGRVRVAHILVGYNSDEPSDELKAATLLRADSVYNQAIGGADFAELAKTYSNDTISGARGGVLNYFGLGEMVESFEQAAFSLQNIGDISKPVQTRFGYHIIKLLDKKTDIPYEEMESQIYENMKRTERNFDLYRGFEEKMKARHGYVFYPEAYAELNALAADYFPTDTNFYKKATQMFKTLITLDSINFPQAEFAEYIYYKARSAKTYSQDFLQEVFDLFVRDIVTELERRNLERDYPEYNMLVKEYYDGILLFEISNKRIWSKPAEEQPALEAEWIKELNEKYPVKINKKVVKQIKKYL